jgi:formylglycine-generating enzyme required for sulfatase activity
MLPRLALGDFSMQLETWDDSDELSGDLTEGVIFRARDQIHFYALLVDPRNGRYTVLKYDGLDKISALIPWSDSPLVKREKEHNLVRIDAQGPAFTIYLNGKQLATFNDGAYAFGMLGMIAANTDAVKPHPHFDNLAIWSADQAPKLADLPAQRENPAGNMVLIQGGEFILGGNERSDALSHIVGLPAFYIDTTEVTNAVYKQCIAAGKCAPPRQLESATHPDYFNNPAYDTFPVIYVTWEQARQFCGWAGKRLPSEAEWEKAASWNAQERTKVLYPWGNAFDPAKLNSADSNSIDVVAPGSYPPEINGTLDMGGNVSEWTNSLAKDYPYNEGDGREEYPAPGERIFRGGSWAQTEGKAKVDNRRSAPQDYPDREIGFRCALTP